MFVVVLLNVEVFPLMLQLFVRKVIMTESSKFPLFDKCFDPSHEANIYLMLLMMEVLVCLIILVFMIIMMVGDRRRAIVPSPLCPGPS